LHNRAAHFYRLALAVITACTAQCALAATIIGSQSSPNPAKITSASGVQMKHDFSLKYFNNENLSCGATVTYSDGVAAENISIAQPVMTITRNKTFSCAGNFQLTLTGAAHSGHRCFNAPRSRQLRGVRKSDATRYYLSSGLA
jgi:hypothetical protein